ncbi:MAG: TlyA family RNA methyltransferase [Clostridium sp.]|uniref:TlyA family RNA methyltransferase n=1 Tax=Clostridium sp. TaxID=1506 RepID=UPI0025B8C023|nr:TlyA family RNA methyltransferase [Clostridium sp.]MBS4956607.1 TlyA family RNA methyltransferase [Clostridium sp.]
MASKKERLDILLVEKGICESREKAKTNIMAGLIFVDGQRVDKAGEKVKVDSDIVFKGEKLKYVSRGGLKLEKAMNTFGIDLTDKVCMDIGASTGGFTDCMLQNNAAKVFAVDVGYGQFAWKLRTDERVVCMEKTNIRYVTPEDIGIALDFASIDVSFISLRTIMPAVKALLGDKGEVVALIKPQFEAGRDKVGKKGVVRDKEVHLEVINTIINFLMENELNVLGLSYSPIKGPEGNREYLVYFTKDKKKEGSFELSQIEDVVNESHSQL